MLPMPVYILAGGRSSRFGSDKARALLGGKPLIVRLANQIQPVAREVTVVAEAADKYADLGLRTIADRRPGLGPLAGIEAALFDAHHISDWIIIFSCDLTAIHPAWIELLAAARRSESKVATFTEPGSRRYPFPGVYHAGLLPAVASCLDEGRLAVRSLIESVDHSDVALPSDWPQVAQVNTPEHLKRADAAGE
ncbi:MAG: molybdenum cofactor guanylyltransferase [Phycisphaerales bacterium]|nr:molybdenum cofactor guanylyltransferase [Phycisphaerales bacterium]